MTTARAVLHVLEVVVDVASTCGAVAVLVAACYAIAVAWRRRPRPRRTYDRPDRPGEGNCS